MAAFKKKKKKKNPPLTRDSREISTARILPPRERFLKLSGVAAEHRLGAFFVETDQFHVFSDA